MKKFAGRSERTTADHAETSFRTFRETQRKVAPAVRRGRQRPNCENQRSKVARELTRQCDAPRTQTLAQHGDAPTIPAARKTEPDRNQAMPREED